mmetsp:Transcript_19910/g.35009  ORF Transcript_19910/g.35009 Transcript_19910/m.35009 type:complete len:350 (-) Transcript_19910:90-1139(-)|eukprot:CAMPEP_0178738912 /NCGR_PEP_ID=MMETSP0744-20121128/3773_1 /TAXON_ID=913974 /ORGANISM="Nitzschia punctata, Strain CCMP561" /LENGTH=349 /DNA_ID=CAMNT_0020391577 /DNA_START=43 /DNA_END=1092 /DNA_ORIENTATION=-
MKLNSTQLQLLFIALLLMGGFFDSSPSKALAQTDLPEADGDDNKKEDDKKDKENEDDDKKANKLEEEDEEENDELNEEIINNEDVTNSPPTIAPTTSSPEPTWSPTTAATTAVLTITPTATSPASLPTLDPFSLVEARLPDIVIDLTTTTSSSNLPTQDEQFESVLQSFMENLLTASKVLTVSSLESTELSISVASFGVKDDSTGAIAKAPETTSSESSSVRIVIDGKVYYYPMALHEYSKDPQGSISHSLLVYFSLWGTDDVEQKLEECGLADPRINAVYVNGTQVVVSEWDDEPESPGEASRPDGESWAQAVSPENNVESSGWKANEASVVLLTTILAEALVLVAIA